MIQSFPAAGASSFALMRGRELKSAARIARAVVVVRPHARAGVECPYGLFDHFLLQFAPYATAEGVRGYAATGAPFRGGMWLRVIGRFRLLGRLLQSLLVPLLLPLVLLIFWPPTGRCRRLACVGAEPRA